MMKIAQWFCVLFCILALFGCAGGDGAAPVVEGWHQPTATQGLYRVRSGDTLYSIAFVFGLDYRKIAELNNIKPPYEIDVGESLRLAGSTPKPTQTQKTAVRHVKRHEPVIKQTTRRRERPLPPMAKHWRWPAQGRIVGRYSGLNKGIDIAGRMRAAIRAANSGVVAYSGHGIRGYGNLIIIKHDNLYLSAYAHNERNLVHEGDHVKAGQVIAEMGNTGSQRVMLHFEIRKAGKPVNPLSFLPRG